LTICASNKSIKPLSLKHFYFLFGGNTVQKEAKSTKNRQKKMLGGRNEKKAFNYVLKFSDASFLYAKKKTMN